MNIEQDPALSAAADEHHEEPVSEEPGSQGPDQAKLDIPAILPVLPVRDIVVFNYMILPLFVGREKSVAAVDAALNSNRYILILTQKDEKVDEPGPDDLYVTGTVGMIMRMLKMPDGRLKVLVQGLTRARVRRFTKTEPHLECLAEVLEEAEAKEVGVSEEALMRAAREQSEKILSLRGISATDIMSVLNSVNEPGRLADLIASNLRMKVEEAQKILETL